MASLGLQGAIRGKPVRTMISERRCLARWITSTGSSMQSAMPSGLVLHHVATWTGSVPSRLRHRRLRRASWANVFHGQQNASFVLDALEQALHDRRPVHRGGLVHQNDCGEPRRSIKYERAVGEGGGRASVGRVGDGYDNALAETINVSQGQDHPSARTMAVIKSRRVRDAGTGGGSSTGGSWSPSAISRPPKPRDVTSHAGRSCHGGVTQTEWPPTNPGRFRPWPGHSACG